MLVLKIIGIIVLILLLVLLGLMLFVLFSRVRINFRGKNGEAEVRAGIGPLHVKLYPIAKKSKKTKKPAEAPAEKKPEKPPAAPDLSSLNTGGTLTYILDLLEQMKDKLILETVLLNVIFATGDAAKTGILLGTSSAMAGMIVPFLEQNFNIEQMQLKFGADFEDKETKWAAVIAFAVRPVSVLHVLWKNRKPLLALYQQIIKKEEATKHE